MSGLLQAIQPMLEIQTNSGAPTGQCDDQSPEVRGDGLNREVIVAPPCQDQWCIIVTAARLQRCADYMPLNSRICKEIRGHRYLLLLHRDPLVKARYL